MDTKPVIYSKTLWANLLGAALALFYPPANEWMVAHPDLVVGMWTAVNVVLRFVTKEKVFLW